MNPTKLLNQVEKLIVDNSPLILTAVGAVGTVTTAYLTGKATFKAAKLIEDKDFIKKQHGEEVLTKNEKISLVWKVYILPFGSAAFTVTAIIASNRISARRAAALVAGYSLLDGRFEEYKDKMKKSLGIQKEQKAKDELAQDRMNDNPPPTSMVIIEGKVLFRDEFSGRYFQSTMEDVRRAVNDVNFKIINDEYAVVTDFYELIGLTPISISEEFGWTLNDRDKFELDFSTVITPTGEPCIVFDLNAHPIRNGSPNKVSQKIHSV